MACPFFDFATTTSFVFRAPRLLFFANLSQCYLQLFSPPLLVWRSPGMRGPPLFFLFDCPPSVRMSTRTSPDFPFP